MCSTSGPVEDCLLHASSHFWFTGHFLIGLKNARKKALGISTAPTLSPPHHQGMNSTSSSSYYGTIEIGAAPPPTPAVFHQTFTAEDEEQLLLFPGNTAKRSGEVRTHLFRAYLHTHISVFHSMYIFLYLAICR
jgi:hypothetical protein